MDIEEMKDLLVKEGYKVFDDDSDVVDYVKCDLDKYVFDWEDEIIEYAKDDLDKYVYDEDMEDINDKTMLEINRDISIQHPDSYSLGEIENLKDKVKDVL